MIRQFIHQGNLKKALSELKKEEQRKGQTPENQVKYKLLKGDILARSGKLEEAIELTQKTLEESESFDIKPLIGQSFNQLGYFFWKKGALDQAMDYYRKSFNIFTIINNQKGLGNVLRNFGSVFLIKGDLNLALEYTKNAVNILEETGDPCSYASAMADLAEIYSNKGEINQAFEYALKSLVIFEEMGAKPSIAENLHAIGDILRMKGDLDGALGFYRRSLTIFNEINMLGALPLARIGEVHHAKEEFDLAFEYYEKSLKYFAKPGFDLLETRTLYYNLIKLCVDTKSPEKAKMYIQQLQQISKTEEDSKLNSQIYRLAQAMLLKSSKRVVKIAEAQKIFRQVAEEEIVYFDITVDAILNLCDMLLDELRSSGNPEILSELDEWIVRLHELAQTQHSYALLAEIYLIQSKLALLELHMERAQELLSQAQKIAVDKDLQQLLTKVADEQILVLDQIDKWDKFGDKKPTMSERIKLTQLEGLINRMLFKKLHGEDEKISEYAERAKELIAEWEESGE